MDISGYTSDELHSFHVALDAAMTEAAERDLDVPLALMAKRLFQAAGNGVRDFEQLKGAILGDMPQPPPLPSMSVQSDVHAALRSSL